MITWACDVCGKETNLNPPVRPVLQKNGAPETEEIESMNFLTGKMEKKTVAKMEDLELRCHIVKVNAGQSQVVQRDFCTDCLKTIEPELNALWRKLANLGGK